MKQLFVLITILLVSSVNSAMAWPAGSDGKKLISYPYALGAKHCAKSDNIILLTPQQ
jgi:hypothetical protein